MKVSVLITCYNTERYIGDAINSVVSQDMPFEWELLVGDDGSTDNTRAIVNEWIAKYPKNIKLYVQERGEIGKAGLRAARNRAFLLEHASGDYINFLDGDDCFLGKDKINNQVDILEDPKNRDCSCVAHNHIDYFIKTGVKKAFVTTGSGDRKYDIRQYWLSHYFHTNTILFRSCCKKMLLDSKYRDFLNDNFITFLLLQFGNIYYSDNIWAQYNRTGDGLWTGHNAVYGDFRNIQLFDLEMTVRKDMNDIILNRHRSSIRKIRREYKHGMEKEITPLVVGLDSHIFKYTILLYKLDGMTMSEIMRKSWLFLRTDISFLQSRVRAFANRIKNQL